MRSHYSNYSEPYQAALTDAQARSEMLRKRGAELVRGGFLDTDWLRHCITLGDVTRAIEAAEKKAQTAMPAAVLHFPRARYFQIWGYDGLTITRNGKERFYHNVPASRMDLVRKLTENVAGTGGLRRPKMSQPVYHPSAK